MGIPYYFASLIRQHKGIVSRVQGTQTPDVLAIDFNCMIHQYLDDARPIESILAALRDLPCRATKTTYIAMDGLVPYGKMVQQRYRRFRTTEGTPVFDRNQISPGTPFMIELAAAVKAAFPSYVVSSTEEPGEGEHKLLAWLKTLPPNQRRSITVYGLDADLILLCLAQKGLSYPYSFQLLRETACFQKEDAANGYSTLSVWKLAERIAVPIPQYIRLCILCFGNDFMPALGMFSLREGGHDRALAIYAAAKTPDLTTLEGLGAFVAAAAARETEVLVDRVRRRNLARERTVVTVDASYLRERYCTHILDGVRDETRVAEAYWRTYVWTVRYFTENQVPDWCWAYPYPDAPLVCQLGHPTEVVFEEAGEPPFKILDQLRFILPSTSLAKAKKRPVFPDEFYIEDTDVRMPWMKRFAWESKPRISLPWNPIWKETKIEEWGLNG